MAQLCAGPLPASQPLETLVPTWSRSVTPSPPSPSLPYRDPYGSCLSHLFFLHLHFLTCHHSLGILFLIRQGRPTRTWGRSAAISSLFAHCRGSYPTFVPPTSPCPSGSHLKTDPLPASSVEPHPSSALPSSALSFSPPSAETWVRQPPI